MSAYRGNHHYHTNKQDLGWREERAERETPLPNIGNMQRFLSALAGAALIAGVLGRRSFSSIALAMAGGSLLYRATSGYCPVLDAVGVDMSGHRHDTNRIGRRKVKTARSTKIRRSIEIHRPPEDLYRYWRALENLPTIMSHLDSVQVINNRLSHWAVKTVAGGPSLEWDAEIINDVENERIGWRSLYGADVENTGSVEFESENHGHSTNLTVTLQYALPGGRLGTAVANMLGEDPTGVIDQDLQRFKEAMETTARTESV